MRRVLFLGFSCTAVQFSYATVLRERLQAAGAEVLLCGLGALTPGVIPVAFDRLNARSGPFSHVILEIGTSGYAMNSLDSRPVARDLALDCLHRVAAAGAKPAVLLLYRADLGAARLPWNRILSKTAGRCGAPVVDLAQGLVEARGEAFARSLLRDEVHATPEGDAFQADQIMERLGDWLADDTPPPVPTPPAWVRRAIGLASHGAETGVFRRQDYAFPFARLRAGETLTIDLPRPLRASGLSFVMGPHAGDLEVATDESEPFVASAFDPFSYFERLGARAFGDPASGRVITRLAVRQRPEAPDVRLLKGEPAPGPREGRLVDLLYFARS